MSAMNVAIYDQLKIAREDTFGHLGGTRILTGGALTRTCPMQSGDTFILLIVMAQAVHATRSCIFMQVRMYLFILLDDSQIASDYS